MGDVIILFLTAMFFLLLFSAPLWNGAPRGKFWICQVM